MKTTFLATLTLVSFFTAGCAMTQPSVPQAQRQFIYTAPTTVAKALAFQRTQAYVAKTYGLPSSASNPHASYAGR